MGSHVPVHFTLPSIYCADSLYSEQPCLFSLVWACIA